MSDAFWYDILKCNVNFYNIHKNALKLKIILLTIINVFKMKDIYEVKEEGTEGLPDEEIAKKEAEKVIAKARLSSDKERRASF